MVRFCACVAVILLSTSSTSRAASRDDEVANALQHAAEYYREHVATHGGYVYHYSLDLQKRWGEGPATRDQIWVQPPGTPTVGLAFLRAHHATGETYYLEAATAAAEALVYGQLKSGGWTNCIDFDPKGERTARYRNGRGGGRNHSSLDDGQTQSALKLLIHTDAAHRFKHATIHEAAQTGLQALLAAQFNNGGFPQVWKGPVSPQPVKQASYPNYDWRTERRIKNYWDMYTLNDNVTGYVTETLRDAYAIYQDDRFLQALRKLGDFLILAQMPQPQPGWAQQYNFDMQPIWARKFEPPGVSGDETQESIQTLMLISSVTNDRKYLKPIPEALSYLKRSQLPDGQLARYYELKTNRPLYMSRRGDVYSLTYDDSNLPSHYGWKTEARIGTLEQQYHALVQGNNQAPERTASELHKEVEEVLNSLDAKGRWISTYVEGERLVGQPKFRPGEKYLSSELFSRNLTLLAEYLSQQSAD